MTLEEICSRLKATKTGSGFEARCPAHQDKKPSLTINQGEDGRILFHCHRGCTYDAICTAIGIKAADLFPERKGTLSKSRIVAQYPYHDEDGKLLSEVVRFEPKDFRQRAPDPAGKDGWTWSTKGVRKVLFRLPEIRKAISESRTIVIAEGEKDVLALVAHGFEATCNPGGAGKWLDGYTESLSGAEVVIFPDNDQPGREHAELVASKLHRKVKSLRVVTLPNVPNGLGLEVKDSADFFAAGGKETELLDLIDAAPEWQPGETKADTLRARKLSELVRPARHDSAELLEYRFLCRGGGLLLAGPTGIGKSAFALQCALLWALNRACFGIGPAWALRSLFIQAENDEGDLAEMRDGVIAGLNLSETEAAKACDSVLIFREDAKTGPEFFAVTVKPLLAEHKPDLLWIDPALSYLGGEANNQKDVGGFLRNLLNPLLREFNCGGIVIHHTNKPPTGREKPEWSGSEFAYLGAGSAEWANWGRGVLAIRATGQQGVFELRAGKRGSRLGWRDSAGGVSHAKWIGHATEPGVICWREVGESEITKPGRPKDYDDNDLLQLLPAEGLETAEWQKLAKSELGIPERAYFRARKSLEIQKRVLKSKISGKWQPITPAKLTK